ncbi:MAG: hypothetical protein AAFX50_01510, partial [Acidobacteriota bacterium]
SKMKSSPGVPRPRVTLIALMMAATLMTTTPILAQGGGGLGEQTAATVADLLGAVHSMVASLGDLLAPPSEGAEGEANGDADQDGGALPSMGFEIEPNG